MWNSLWISQKILYCRLYFWLGNGCNFKFDSILSALNSFSVRILIAKDWKTDEWNRIVNSFLNTNQTSMGDESSNFRMSLKAT